MKIVNHRLVKEEGDPFSIWYDQSPNMGGSMSVKHLILHATQGPLLGTINWFKQHAGTSTHLIISEDGDEIVQMVPFNRRAVHAHAYNANSIGIELEYPGPLLNTPRVVYRYLQRFQPNQQFTTTPQNDTKIRTWTNFQPQQLETLLEVTRLLMETYPFESVIRHEDINAGKIDPGPMFPMVTFNEKLSGKREIIMEETRRNIHIRTGPGMAFPTVLDSALSAGAKVSVIDERRDWVLVEVMDSFDSNDWLVGWIPSEYIKVASFTPVIKDHRLAAKEGGFAKFITPSPGNYDPKGKLREIKYLVMHITGGTNMQGVVNYFKNPTSGVSAHLLIGRDGRVVQFIPFDGVAFHCGFSYWEGDENLNLLSIGIEIDNAGYLRGGPGKWSFKGVSIPDSQVVELTHWKHYRPKGWETFPDIQLDVAYAIAEALVKKYGIKEIISHDEINLVNRLDPGPAFPMQEWRDRIYPGEGRPNIQKYRIDEEAEIYEHVGQKSPAQNTPKIGRLGEKSKLQIRDEVGKWSLVRVILPSKNTTNKSKIKSSLGWIEKRTIKEFGGAIRNLVATDFYEQSSLSAKAGPPLLLMGTLPRGTLVRYQVERPEDGWTLIATLEPVGRVKWMEGWVRSDKLVKAEDFVPAAGHGSQINS